MRKGLCDPSPGRAVGRVTSGRMAESCKVFMGYSSLQNESIHDLSIGTVDLSGMTYKIMPRSTV